jgi:DNA-binding transcriptional ArsR family regulator
MLTLSTGPAARAGGPASGRPAVSRLGYVGLMSGKTAPDGEHAAAARDTTATRDTVLMRALAHPARLALLDRLSHGGPATATECAEVVGLSPSAVSYHLRALARAGLVEEAPGRGDGRERRWRRTTEGWEVGGVSGQGPAAVEAMRALLESMFVLSDSRARQYLTRVAAEPGEWQDASFFMDSALLVTAQELQALGQAVLDLTAPYRENSRADRPDGARMVSVTVRAFPT